jgi:hypothetical protein
MPRSAPVRLARRDLRNPAGIAASCGVTPMTVHRHIITTTAPKDSNRTLP